MTTQYINQAVSYSDGVNTLTLNPNVGLQITDGTTTLTSNTTGFTNGVESLLFTDLYATVEKTRSVKFLTSTPSTLSVVDKIEVVDNNITPTYQSDLIPTSLTITEIATSNYTSYGFDGLTIVNTNGVSNTNTITDDEIVITNNVNGESNTIDQNSIHLTSPTFNQVILSNDISVNDPFLRLDDSLGRSTIYSNISILADNGYCYTLTNGTRFLKQQNPFSFKNNELVDNDYIEPYIPFVMIQNGTLIKLRNVADYLDDGGLAGWSCIVSNYSGGSLDIDIANASSWYSHSSGGGQSNPIILKNWGTSRITLVFSSIDSQYIWAVSEY